MKTFHQYFLQTTGVVISSVLITLSIGCAPKYNDLKVFLQEHEHDVAAVNYRVEPPDIISITSPTAPEIDGESQKIRNDGKISLKLLGEVKVSQMTPQEISAKLEKLLEPYYVEPKVNVRVASNSSKKIFVFGQVMKSGPMEFTGRDSLLDVLAESQLNSLAWGAQVKVIRPSASKDQRREIIVDVDKMMQSGDLTANILLQEGDIVYVPPTPLAWVGLRIQEALFPFAPIGSAYTTPAQFMYATDYYKDRNHYGRSRYMP